MLFVFITTFISFIVKQLPTKLFECIEFLAKEGLEKYVHAKFEPLEKCTLVKNWKRNALKREKEKPWFLLRNKFYKKLTLDLL